MCAATIGAFAGQRIGARVSERSLRYASAAIFAGFGIVTPRSVYGYVDWSVIVLLGALIPVAAVLGDTGAAYLIAR